MHVWSLNLSAMPTTVPEFRKHINTVLQLVLHVHVRSKLCLTLYFADVAEF
jgi:hypothetical protein